MKKRIFNSLCFIAVLVAVAVTLALDLFHDYWESVNPNGLVWDGEYLIYAAAIVSVIIVAAAGISLIMANSIVRPLVRSEDDYVEVSHLKKRIVDQSSKLKDSNEELEEKAGNLSFVIANMSEGLMLLDRKGIIITVNNSACALLEIESGEYVGKHIFAANDSPIIQAAVYGAFGGKTSREVIELADSVLEFTVNPVFVERVIRGAVVLIRDVTEKQAAEKMRREFSANVSHELKTPLTSISGYAEILKEGMAKSEDVGWIASKIYDEAQRLVSLTDDIMRLSRLDEGSSEIPMEAVSLLQISSDVLSRLEDKSKEHSVELSLSGAEDKILGNRRLLDEMIFNLCDNAIKYNKVGGKVDVRISASKEYVTLTVADTGVGIPREHVDRVFERFYRVDKSHSKATGGTGLGLSIVKNGAAFHKATLDLDSKLGKGTTIHLQFQKLRHI